MSERAGDNRASAESVSPKIYIPAVTTITVFVLIVFAVAVFVILRAYKKRQKHRRMYRSGPDLEAASYVGPNVWRRGVWENESLRSRGRETQHVKGPLVTIRQDSGISVPEPVAAASVRPAWNSRFPIATSQFSRHHILDDTPVVEVEESDLTSSTQTDSTNVHVAEITLGIKPNKPKSVPKLSKLERMTGSKLSNDLYEERKSGQRETRSDVLAQRRKIQSYPTIHTSVRPERQSISLDTSVSPTSPTTTVWSPDFSLENPGAGLTPLAPPPPPISITRIVAEYPNIAALAQANIQVSEDARRHQRDTSLSSANTEAGNQHIASQFNPARHNRIPSGYSAQSSAATARSRRHMPKSGAFGQSDLHRYGSISSRFSNRTSISNFHHGISDLPPIPMLPPDMRHSWNGRSVLFLDEAAPVPAQPTRPYPPPPPPPPEEPTTSLSRTQSKISVSSMPSSISSFNTIHNGTAVITGLTPTPAPRTPKISRDDASTISTTASGRNRKMRREEDEDIENQPARSSFGFL